jgi:hypothetical protein
VRTDCCDENEGEFVFKINGRETFIMGTNWVPADALYSNADNRRKKLMPYMDDLGFNMVRVWGGGIYESDYIRTKSLINKGDLRILRQHFVNFFIYKCLVFTKYTISFVKKCD